MDRNVCARRNASSAGWGSLSAEARLAQKQRGPGRARILGILRDEPIERALGDGVELVGQGLLAHQEETIGLVERGRG